MGKTEFLMLGAYILGLRNQRITVDLSDLGSIALHIPLRKNGFAKQINDVNHALRLNT